MNSTEAACPTTRTCLCLPAPVDLANFQVDAVRWGLNTIDRYGGCYVGDVVGLGKTYIGAELLRQVKQSYPRDGKPSDYLSLPGLYLCGSM